MWKFVNESVGGTSHRLSGAACQDASFVTPFRSEADVGLILACSDGAGSATESEFGSRLACDSVVHLAMQFLQSGKTVADLSPETLLDWMRSVHLALNAEAERRTTTPRELACTLLLCIVGQTAAACAQIGDGAIVISEGGGYRPVFWPQSGEYQNFTFFLTDPKFERNVHFEIINRAVLEVAIFSDGLQMLALKYDTKAAHQPFFAPLFSALRASSDAQDLIVPMREFLDSPRVNDRTDDDKTLILATRLIDEPSRSDATTAAPRDATGAADTTTGHADSTV
jgi:hypothetical protein